MRRLTVKMRRWKRHASFAGLLQRDFFQRRLDLLGSLFQNGKRKSGRHASRLLGKGELSLDGLHDPGDGNLARCHLQQEAASNAPNAPDNAGKLEQAHDALREPVGNAGAFGQFRHRTRVLVAPLCKADKELHGVACNDGYPHTIPLRGSKSLVPRVLA